MMCFKLFFDEYYDPKFQFFKVILVLFEVFFLLNYAASYAYYAIYMNF
jgi:hypothetical protein